MKLRKNQVAPGVVASVEQQTAQAEALASISGQARLLDPRTNPAVRGHADQLLTDQLIRKLDAEDGQLKRRIRVKAGRAADAERTLEAIQLARQASSPARSVLALHDRKRTYLRLSLGASLVLAAGSAMGVEATAHALHAHAGTGYIAEVGLTGLATAAISYRAHLAEHGGKLTKGTWQSNVLWALMVVPLLVSVGCNLGTLNVVGAFCAIGAAAFSLLANVVADRSADAMQARAAEVSGQDEVELRSVAMGEDLFAAVPDTPEREGLALVDEPAEAAEDEQDAGELTEAEQDAEELEAAFAAGREDEYPDAPVGDEDSDQDQDDVELELLEAQQELVELETWWLRHRGPEDPPGDGGVRPASRSGPDSRPKGAAADPIDETPGEHIDSDLPEGDDKPSRVLPAAQARRAIGASTRQRIAKYLAAHPTATNTQVARELGLSPKTVQRFRNTKTERKAS